ncbi:MAG: divalent-cation tolerance protein CutA [Candidatus Binatia bacterium]|nr:divalent-cation tolerance protein CutA [Candidatus Binatia bacterium]
MTASKLYVVLVTTASLEEATKIGEHLVSEQLAACVNIVGPIRSLYLWDDKLNNDSEYLLIIKAGAENYAALEQAVRERHSYQVPEILALEVAGCSPAYLQWALSARPKSPNA